jgi:WD40 repeat protein
VLLSGGNHELRRWDVQSGQLIQEYITFGTNNFFVSAVLDEREENIFALNGRGFIHTWTLDTARDELGLLCNSCGNDFNSNIGFSTNGRFALVRNSALVLGQVQNLATDFLHPFGVRPLGQPFFAQANSIIVSGARVSPDARWAVYIDIPNVNTAQLWDATNDEMVHELVRAFDFTAYNQFVLTAGDDCPVRIWDIDSGQEMQRLVTPNVRILSAVFSANSRFRSSSNDD